MREPLFVPESLTVDRLLDRLSGKRTMAVVIDEYGGTAGVATLEDIVEEVVGEVRDEHDPHETPDLAPAGTDEEERTLYSADGSARTDQLARVGLRVPDGPYETLAGLLATELGRIPPSGTPSRSPGGGSTWWTPRGGAPHGCCCTRRATGSIHARGGSHVTSGVARRAAAAQRGEAARRRQAARGEAA